MVRVSDVSHSLFLSRTRTRAGAYSPTLTFTTRKKDAGVTKAVSGSGGGGAGDGAGARGVLCSIAQALHPRNVVANIRARFSDLNGENGRKKEGGSSLRKRGWGTGNAGRVPPLWRKGRREGVAAVGSGATALMVGLVGGREMGSAGVRRERTGVMRGRAWE